MKFSLKLAALALSGLIAGAVQPFTLNTHNCIAPGGRKTGPLTREDRRALERAQQKRERKAAKRRRDMGL
jgi:hypothetical protein